ncbi:Pre-mRNA polyadenylation factor Fip1 [Macleaya cordata]|uniref:Pre-mRNA polyadenylation factor Fip1 n=1 Tax=Macleaya cordata TaxID=56857 RepID=A0A200PWB2_MACCD|nr:Pre-mRNA polyadenylation factor Fip1 [Macleaya cordata]
MEDMEDDFGDLYADVEVQENENVRSNIAEGGFHSDSNFNKVDLAMPKDEKTIPDDSKTLGMEANGEKDLILDNGSDSEDDLHILLNEEDCRMYPAPHDANVRNMGMVERRDDEDDDLVSVTEADKSSKDMKRVEKLQLLSDGLEQSSAGQVGERGNGMKCSYSAQYSQYKYFRPHTTAFPSIAKPNGAGVAVSFSSSLSGRSDWDLNGFNHSVGSNTAFPVVSQGRDFSLPRYRTIFDVNIETFERKAWRHPGVDITDFFNFGLDEESWKHYCNNMEQFRQQATMLTKIPIHGPNQAFEAEFGHETVAPEVVAGDLIAQSGNSGLRLLEIPKGRAIQVEGGGSCERRPSMDIRRSRNRDSDVVIQIPVQDSKEWSPSSSREEQGYVDTTMVEGSENGGSDLDDNRDGHSMEVMDEYSRRFDPKDPGARPLTRCSEHPLCLDPDIQGNDQILDVDGCHHQKVRGYVSEEVTEATETRMGAKEGVNKNPIKARACVSEAESSLGDQIQPSFSPSYLDSKSEASKAGGDIDMEDARKLAKMPSMNSITGLPESITSDSYYQKESGSNESKTERPVGSKDDSKNHLMQVEHNSHSRMRLCSVAELKIHSDDDEPSPLSDRKGWYDRNHLTKVYGTRRERKSNYDFNDGEDMSLYRETEISVGYRNGRFTKKQVRNAGIQRKGYPHFRDEVNPYLRRHRDEREYFFRKRDAGRDNENEVMERELYLCEKGHTNGGISGVTQDESIRSSSENSSLYRDEERYRWQTRKRDDEYGFRKGIEVDDFVFEHRYKEEIYQEKYGRHVPYDGRERDYSQEKYDRDGPYVEREIKRCDRRERYGGNSCFDDYKSWNIGGRDDECWRRSDHESFPPYSHRESYISNERGYHDTTSPGNDLFDSRRSDGRSVDNWTRIHSEKHRNSSWFDPNFMDHENADRAIYPDDHACNDRRRYIWQSNSAMDNLSSRRQSRGRLYDEEASFSCEMSLRHKYIHVKQDSVRGEMLLDQNRLERDRSRIIREESRNIEVKDEQAALRFRDSVDLHLVGWEGKSSGRSSKVVAAWGSGRNNNIDYEIDNEQRTFRHSEKLYGGKIGPPHFHKVESNCSRRINSNIERVGRSHLEHHTNQSNEKLLEKYPDGHHHEALVLEGRLGVEDPETNKRKIASNGDMKEKILNSEDSIKCDNQRILETLAKMEKRRERFKEAITLKNEPDKNPMPQSDVEVEAVEPAEAKQQRPARKRRWGGN